MSVFVFLFFFQSSKKRANYKIIHKKSIKNILPNNSKICVFFFFRFLFRNTVSDKKSSVKNIFEFRAVAGVLQTDTGQTQDHKSCVLYGMAGN